MTAIVRRELPAFKLDDVSNPERLARVLNDFSAELSSRLAELENKARVAVLDEIVFETQASVGPLVEPFPIRVQTPFSIAGAWMVLMEDITAGDAGIPTSGTVPWVRPVSGGVDGEDAGLDILYVTGLTDKRMYRMRLAVVGVRNG